MQHCSTAHCCFVFCNQSWTESRRDLRHAGTVLARDGPRPIAIAHSLPIPTLHVKSSCVIHVCNTPAPALRTLLVLSGLWCSPSPSAESPTPTRRRLTRAFAHSPIVLTSRYLDPCFMLRGLSASRHLKSASSPRPWYCTCPAHRRLNQAEEAPFRSSTAPMRNGCAVENPRMTSLPRAIFQTLHLLYL